MNAPPQKALIFDVDGTLADTEQEGHRIAFERAFADAGLDWRWDPVTYRGLLAVAGGKERIAHYARTLGHPVDADFVARLHASKTRHYTSLLGGGEIGLRPGIERLLREGRDAGRRLAIATTTTPANVDALLRSTLGDDGPGWFEVVGAADSVAHKKPSPDVYTWVLEQMALAPDDVVAFEDSDNGVRAALGAGIERLVVTVTADTEDHELAGAPLVLDCLGEPDRPARVLRGAGPAQGFVDLGFLDAWR